MAPMWTPFGKTAVLRTETCGGRLCSAAATLHCSYIDQWGWNCALPCCAAHGLELGGAGYCHKHASLYLTVGGNAQPLSCEIDDPFCRRPSLVTWVPRDLDGDMRNLLCDAAEAPRGSQVQLSETITVGEKAAVIWETRWELSGGSPLSASFVLEGYSDPAIVARRDGTVVLREFPRWLRHALYADGLDAETESILRRDLFRRLHNALTAGVTEMETALTGYSFIPVERRRPLYRDAAMRPYAGALNSLRP